MFRSPPVKSNPPRQTRQRTVARPARRPKSYPDVEARGTLTTGADRLADLFAGVAVLEIARGDDDLAWY
jgi:hypothetical protein